VFRAQPTTNCNGGRSRTARHKGKSPTNEAPKTRSARFVAYTLGIACKPIGAIAIAFREFLCDKRIHPRKLRPAFLTLQTPTLHIDRLLELLYFGP
jgi:hypothetical protein